MSQQQSAAGHASLMVRPSVLDSTCAEATLANCVGSMPETKECFAPESTIRTPADFECGVDRNTRPQQNEHGQLCSLSGGLRMDEYPSAAKNRTGRVSICQAHGVCSEQQLEHTYKSMIDRLMSESTSSRWSMVRSVSFEALPTPAGCSTNAKTIMDASINSITCDPEFSTHLQQVLISSTPIVSLEADPGTPAHEVSMACAVGAQEDACCDTPQLLTKSSSLIQPCYVINHIGIEEEDTQMTSVSSPLYQLSQTGFHEEAVLAQSENIPVERLLDDNIQHDSILLQEEFTPSLPLEHQRKRKHSTSPSSQIRRHGTVCRPSKRPHFTCWYELQPQVCNRETNADTEPPSCMKQEAAGWQLDWMTRTSSWSSTKCTCKQGASRRLRNRASKLTQIAAGGSHHQGSHSIPASRYWSPVAHLTLHVKVKGVNPDHLNAETMALLQHHLRSRVPAACSLSCISMRAGCIELTVEYMSTRPAPPEPAPTASAQAAAVQSRIARSLQNRAAALQQIQGQNRYPGPVHDGRNVIPAPRMPFTAQHNTQHGSHRSHHGRSGSQSGSKSGRGVNSGGEDLANDTMLRLAGITTQPIDDDDSDLSVGVSGSGRRNRAQPSMHSTQHQALPGGHDSLKSGQAQLMDQLMKDFNSAPWAKWLAEAGATISDDTAVELQVEQDGKVYTCKVPLSGKTKHQLFMEPMLKDGSMPYSPVPSQTIPPVMSEIGTQEYEMSSAVVIAAISPCAPVALPPTFDDMTPVTPLMCSAQPVHILMRLATRRSALHTIPALKSTQGVRFLVRGQGQDVPVKIQLLPNPAKGQSAIQSTPASWAKQQQYLSAYLVAQHTKPAALPGKGGRNAAHNTPAQRARRVAALTSALGCKEVYGTWSTIEAALGPAKADPDVAHTLWCLTLDISALQPPCTIVLEVKIGTTLLDTQSLLLLDPSTASMAPELQELVSHMGRSDDEALTNRPCNAPGSETPQQQYRQQHAQKQSMPSSQSRESSTPLVNAISLGRRVQQQRAAAAGKIHMPPVPNYDNASSGLYDHSSTDDTSSNSSSNHASSKVRIGGASDAARHLLRDLGVWFEYIAAVARDGSVTPNVMMTSDLAPFSVTRAVEAARQLGARLFQLSMAAAVKDPVFQAHAVHMGCAMLHYTVEAGWPETASRLLASLVGPAGGLSFSDVKIYRGMTLLDRALASGRAGMLRTVVSWGQQFAQRWTGRYPVHRDIWADNLSDRMSEQQMMLSRGVSTDSMIMEGEEFEEDDMDESLELQAPSSSLRAAGLPVHPPSVNASIKGLWNDAGDAVMGSQSQDATYMSPSMLQQLQHEQLQRHVGVHSAPSVAAATAYQIFQDAGLLRPPASSTVLATTPLSDLRSRYSSAEHLQSLPEGKRSYETKAVKPRTTSSFDTATRTGSVSGSSAPPQPPASRLAAHLSRIDNMRNNPLARSVLQAAAATGMQAGQDEPTSSLSGGRGRQKLKVDEAAPASRSGGVPAPKTDVALGGRGIMLLSADNASSSSKVSRKPMSMPSISPARTRAAQDNDEVHGNAGWLQYKVFWSTRQGGEDGTVASPRVLPSASLVSNAVSDSGMIAENLEGLEIYDTQADLGAEVQLSGPAAALAAPRSGQVRSRLMNEPEIVPAEAQFGLDPGLSTRLSAGSMGSNLRPGSFEYSRAPRESSEWFDFLDTPFDDSAFDLSVRSGVSEAVMYDHFRSLQNSEMSLQQRAAKYEALAEGETKQEDVQDVSAAQDPASLESEGQKASQSPTVEHMSAASDVLQLSCIASCWSCFVLITLFLNFLATVSSMKRSSIGSQAHYQPLLSLAITSVSYAAAVFICTYHKQDQQGRDATMPGYSQHVSTAVSAFTDFIDQHTNGLGALFALAGIVRGAVGYALQLPTNYDMFHPLVEVCLVLLCWGYQTLQARASSQHEPHADTQPHVAAPQGCSKLPAPCRSETGVKSVVHTLDRQLSADIKAWGGVGSSVVVIGLGLTLHVWLTIMSRFVSLILTR